MKWLCIRVVCTAWWEWLLLSLVVFTVTIVALSRTIQSVKCCREDTCLTHMMPTWFRVCSVDLLQRLLGNCALTYSSSADAWFRVCSVDSLHRLLGNRALTYSSSADAWFRVCSVDSLHRLLGNRALTYSSSADAVWIMFSSSRPIFTIRAVSLPPSTEAVLVRPDAHVA